MNTDTGNVRVNIYRENIFTLSHKEMRKFYFITSENEWTVIQWQIKFTFILYCYIKTIYTVQYIHTVYVYPLIKNLRKICWFFLSVCPFFLSNILVDMKLPDCAASSLRIKTSLQKTGCILNWKFKLRSVQRIPQSLTFAFKLCWLPFWNRRLSLLSVSFFGQSWPARGKRTQTHISATADTSGSH